MPRNVRNWWIVLEVDGRQSTIATGPRAKDGGFSLRVFQRGAPEECTEPAIRIDAVEMDGGLFLGVKDRNHDAPALVLETRRDGAAGLTVRRGAANA